MAAPGSVTVGELEQLIIDSTGIVVVFFFKLRRIHVVLIL